MKIEIDQKSGFCFGVVKAIGIAEQTLKTDGFLYSLGHIVHNESELYRLQNLGLQIIDHDEFFKLKNCKVLIRAHGEPIRVYDYAKINNITLIDATCPVVLKLQQRVKNAAIMSKSENGQLIIFGHHGHAEVIGLASQTNDEAIIIDDPDDLKRIDPNLPIVLFSQTTKSVSDFQKLKKNIIDHSQNKKIEIHDTICRQVSNRVFHLDEFAAGYDVIIFVGGKKSSNAQVLFEICKKRNINTFFISTPDEINTSWINGVETVGICGATSTPKWLMEAVAARIKQL